MASSSSQSDTESEEEETERTSKYIVTPKQLRNGDFATLEEAREELTSSSE